MTEPVQPATEGRIVHVRTPGVSHCQPAIVVRNWSPIEAGAVNVLVFRDGGNDREADGFKTAELVHWATSVTHESMAASPDTQRTWHWPERV
ncbi:MAG: hypothetical protein U0838_13140 [Chloroflexota bacterium]